MIIGLTGLSGSGKGAVAEIMYKKGALILDCDDIAHKNMTPEGVAYGELVSAFGEVILNNDGTINRKKLGSIVFSNKQCLSRLNAITHRYIVEEVKKSIAKHRDKRCIVIDAPLLFETGLEKCCDSVWAVCASVDIRAERVMLRDGIDKKTALMRFSNQRTLEELVSLCDEVIYNEGSIEELSFNVIRLMESYNLV